jgi:hypothetical protein
MRIKCIHQVCQAARVIAYMIYVLTVTAQGSAQILRADKATLARHRHEANHSRSTCTIKALADLL